MYHICRDMILKKDMILNLKNNFYTTNNKAVFITDKLWPNQSTIKVGFIGGLTWEKAWIAKVVSETISLYVNLDIQFIFNSTQTYSCDIRISFNPNNGCYSYIGTDSIDPSIIMSESMNFGWMDAPFSTMFSYKGVTYQTPSNFERGGYPGLGTTIVHEFGHALGMLHEHQSPFNNPLIWNVNKLYTYFNSPPNNWSISEIDNNIINRYSIANLNGSGFDPDSIMKYSFSGTFLLNPTITLINYIEQLNLVLSSCDKHWLTFNYPGKINIIYCSTNISTPIPTPTPTPPTPTPTPPPSNPPPHPPPSNPPPTPTPTPPPSNPTPTPTPPPTPTPSNNSLDIIMIISIFIVVFFIIFFLIKFK